MELTREYILRLQKNRRGTTGGGSGTAGTSGNYVTPAQLESALANKVDVDFFSRLFELYNGEGTTAAKIETNATLPDDTSKLNIKAPFDFWSQRSVSALGMNNSGGGSAFDEAAMWTALGGSIDNQQIALSHLTTALNGYVKGVKVGETTYSPNASGIVDLGTITGRTYAFATGTTNGTFKVTPSVGDAYEVAIKGLGSLAYKSGLTAEDIPNLDATKITTGILGTDRIPGLAASKIVSGTLDADRIPGLAASKIVSGTLDAARIPSLSWNKITTDKPTTLAGYGITDAKIVDGVITLGGNSITPLTDAKIKNGYEWWGQKLDASGKVDGDITVTKTGNNIAVKLVGSDYNFGLHLGSGGTNRGIYEFSPANKWLMYFDSSNTILNHGNVGVGTASPYTNLDVNGGVKATKFYFYKPNAGNDTNAVYLVYESANGGVHLVGAGFYADEYVSALGLSDSGGGSAFDEDAMWTALGTNSTSKLIASAYLGNVTKALTITSGNTTVVYDGTVARSITINDMAAKQLTASTIDGTAGSFFFYGDNLINNQYDWVGLQVDKSGSAADRGQLVWDSGSISVRQNDGDSWTDWALVLTNKNYASQIAAGTITNAMLAGSIANSKLANSSVTVNGSSVSLGGSVTTAKWGTARNINIASSDGTGAGTSVSVDGSAAKTLLLPSIIKASLTGNADTATKLNTGTSTYSAWGQTYWSNGVPNSISGLLSSVSGIKINSTGSTYGYIDFHYASTAGYTSNIYEPKSGQLAINSLLYVAKGGYVGVGTNSPSTLLHVNGYTRTNRLYLQSDSVYFELDSSGNVHLVGAGFYSDSFVSALGLNDSGSGGGVTLNEPLASINSSSLGSPSGHNNSTLIYNGSSWVWSNTQGATLALQAITGYSGSFNFGNFISLTVGNKAVATQEWVTNKYYIGPIAAGSYDFNFADDITTGGVYQIHAGSATKQSSWPFDYGLVANFVSTNGHLQLAASSDKNDIRIRSYWWTGSSSFGAYPEWKTLLHSGNTYISGQTITINGTSLTVPTGAGGDYLPLNGGTMSGNIAFNSVNHGVYVKDPAGNSVPAIYQNGENLWIGAAATASTHHRGATYISAGHTGTGGHSTIYISVPNTSNTDGTNYPVLHSGNYSTYIDKYVAKAGDTMTGGLTINYNSGTALSVNGAYSLNGVGTLSGLNLTASASQGITFKGSSTGRALLGLDWYTNSAGTLTVSNSTDNSGIFSYGGFKKSGSSDSYVLLGGGGHKALSDFSTSPTSYVTSGTNGLSSYWVKAWDVTITDRQHDDANLTLLVQSEFNNLRGIIAIRIRQNGTNNGGSYNFSTKLTQITGNLNCASFRLYYNNYTGACELWCNVTAQYGVYNFTVLKKCWRATQDSVSMIGTLYNTVFSKVQTLPTVSTYAYSMIQMHSSDFNISSTAGTDIASGANLNNILESGTYVCQSGATAQGVSNTPYTGGNFRLWHIQNTGTPGASGQYSAQILMAGNEGRMFYRGRDNTSWTPWYEFVTTRGGTTLSGDIAVSKGNASIFVQTANNTRKVGLNADSNYGVYSWSNGGWLIGCNGTNTFIEVGNVGIGTRSPSYKLHVNGSAYATSLNINGGIDIEKYSPSSGVNVMRFYTISNASIDVNTGSGTASINKAWSVGSDMRLKNVWRHFDIDVNSVARAPLFTYRLKSGGSQLMVGTSAQYWMEKIPETVTTGYDGFYSLDYNGVLTASVISVARKVVDHELRIKQLQERVKELETELDELKAA